MAEKTRPEDDRDPPTEESTTMEEKTEHLMNVVVESRKQFGKRCVDYANKCTLIEDKILSLKLKKTASYGQALSKARNMLVIPEDSDHDSDDDDAFIRKLKEKQETVEALRKKVKDLQTIVNITTMSKSDSDGNKLQVPLNLKASEK